jgi:O-acetyl-ADP-ribose deacetylase (regulator of RNase III)
LVAPTKLLPARKKNKERNKGVAMTVEFKTGDLLKEPAQALVNTVNCVGVMGKGIALQFKKAYPENYYQYRIACDKRLVVPGTMFIVPIDCQRHIINFPTKRHWRENSRLGDIKSGLAALIEEVQEREIMSIAIPKLGCGNGGLDWDVVKPLIVTAFEELPDVRVVIFE